MNSNLDLAAFAAAYTSHEETDCGNECGPKGCICLETCIRAYISRIAVTPADLRSVLAYDAGVSEGRRQGLEEAARVAGRATIPEDCAPAEAHGRLMQAAASRDAVLALIKEPKA